MTKEEDQAATEAALAEVLAKGGQIQKLKHNQSGRVEGESYNPWSKKKTSTSPLANPPEDDDLWSLNKRTMRGSYSGNTSAFQADAESSILLPRSNY